MKTKAAATQLTHLGEAQRPSLSRPKAPPLIMSSVYSFNSLADLDNVYEGDSDGYIYNRMNNPIYDTLKDIMTAVDGGEDAMVYASGMGAITMTLISQLRTGDHVVASNAVYGGTYEYFRTEAPRFGFDVTFSEPTAEAMEPLIRENTKFIYIETISNPLIRVTDIQSVSEMAHRRGLKVIVDNTFATPIVCNPLKLGADIVVYSATKHICGHSDAMGGIVISNKEEIKKIWKVGETYGPVMSPFDGWLLARSLRTLDVRMRKHSENALKLAKFLEQTGRFTKVNYPGLNSSPSAPIAARQFNDNLNGAMLSVVLDGDERMAAKLIDQLQLVQLVPSLACVNTTLSYPSRDSHRYFTDDDLQLAGISRSLIRISVGLEQIEDVIADFDSALKAL